MAPADGHVLSAEIERVAKAGQRVVAARRIRNVRLTQDVSSKNLILFALIPVDASVRLIVVAR